MLPDEGVQGQRVKLYRNVLDVSEMNSIIFSVKAGNDAHILLSEEAARRVHDDKYAEIVLGGWSGTKSIIRLGNQNAHNTVDTPNILDATSYREFWLSWDHNMVKVGRGLHVGQEVFMEKRYPFNIKHMSVWNGFGSPGAWQIYICRQIISEPDRLYSAMTRML